MYKSIKRKVRQTQMRQFETNKTYEFVHTSGCGFDEFKFTIKYIIVKRTDKTIWYKLLDGYLTKDLDNKVQKAKIRFCDWADSEYFDLNYGSCLPEFAYIEK